MRLEYIDPFTEGLIQLIFNEEGVSLRSFEKHDADTLTIAWNRGGAATALIDDQEIILGSNEVIILNANQSFSAADTAAMVFWRFNRKFYCVIDHDQEVSCVGLLFYGHKGVPRIVLSENDLRKLELLFNVFLEEYDEADDNLKSEMLRTMLKRLIVKLTRLYKNQVRLEMLEDVDLDAIRNFNLLVEKNFRKLHQVQDYSALLHKSPKTISNLFSKHGGKSPLEVIHDRLLLEAKRLLMYTDKTTKEIAYELGFSDIPNFSRFFKKSTQLSPSNYRSEHQLARIGKN